MSQSKNPSRVSVKTGNTITVTVNRIEDFFNSFDQTNAVLSDALTGYIESCAVKINGSDPAVIRFIVPELAKSQKNTVCGALKRHYDREYRMLRFIALRHIVLLLSGFLALLPLFIFSLFNNRGTLAALSAFVALFFGAWGIPELYDILNELTCLKKLRGAKILFQKPKQL